MNRDTKIFVFALAALFLLSIGLYFRQLDESLASVRATRPVLVFTLIIAMLGFGGMLMAKALFDKEETGKFAVRFRQAREIFLVYAGIFGTIIGFYFGAADEGDTNPPPSAAIAVRGRTVSVQINGGSPPFIGYIEQSDPPIDMMLKASGERLLTVQLTGDECPNQASVVVVDGRGRRGSFAIASKDITDWGKEGCGEASPTSAAAENDQASASNMSM